MSQDTQAKNEGYYNHAYSSKFIIRAVIKLLLSYDQLSKTRRNLRAIKENIQSSKESSVLDYGFGHGTFLLRMPRNYKLFGCELSSEAADNLTRLSSIFHRKVNLFTPHELGSSSNNIKVGVICCSHVLEHVDDDIGLLTLFYKKLNYRGQLLLNVPINEVWDDPNHVRSYSVESAVRLVEKHGFSIDKIMEEDRWTAFILSHEKSAGIRYKILCKLLRLLLALMPVSILDLMEIHLPDKYQKQQLILVASKQES